nr:MAG TPA: hypothetical protein [Caudoviricetes sp.]
MYSPTGMVYIKYCRIKSEYILNIFLEVYMENDIVKEIRKDLNWKEKIIVKIFTKTFIKVSNISRIKTINYMIKY